MEAYPTLKEEDVKAAVEYAIRIVKNEEVIEYLVAYALRFLIDENISPKKADLIRIDRLID
jgi:hypothetical protein